MIEKTQRPFSKKKGWEVNLRKGWGWLRISRPGKSVAEKEVLIKEKGENTKEDKRVEPPGKGSPRFVRPWSGKG